MPGRQVQAAVDAVIRAELSVGELLAETARLTERLVVKRLTLRALSFFETTSAEERRAIQDTITAPLPGMPGEAHQFAQHAVVQTIAEMRAQLAADATAAVEKL